MVISSGNNTSLTAVYQGTVRHRRFVPVSHRFSYRIAMLMLDLDHADRELDWAPFAGRSRWRIGAWLPRDYIGPPDADRSESPLGATLKRYVAGEVNRQLNIHADGKILLLTHLRYWGFMMNPIAVFYCYDREHKLVATCLQVTNTPWREKILYVLPARDTGTSTNAFDKKMHVSPYNPMDMSYTCRLQNPGKRLFLHLENHTLGEDQVSRHTDATMVFDRTPFSRRRLALLCLRQPAMTLKVGLGIYWQALRLWIKRSPVHDHPGPRPRSSTEPVVVSASTPVYKHQES